MSDKNQIARLSAENSELRARLDSVEGKLAPKRPPPAPVDEGTKVTTGLLPTTRELPSPEAYERLLAVVARSFPKIVPDFSKPNRFEFSHDRDRREYLAGFVACFERLGSLWRFNGTELGKPRAEFWVNDTNRMLGARADINLSHLMAAAIAWGDVNFSLGRWPYDVYLGLSYSTGRDVRPANAASWRAVLTTGKTRPEIITQQQQQRAPRPQQLLIRG